MVLKNLSHTRFLRIFVQNSIRGLHHNTELSSEF